MKKTYISNLLYRKYYALYQKIRKAIRSGRFVTYSTHKKRSLLHRLEHYEHRLCRKGIAVAGVATLMLGTPLLQAQGALPVGGEFRVNTHTAGSQDNPSIAVDSHGNFVIVWEGLGNQDRSGVHAQRYDSNGNTIGIEFRVNTYTTADQRRSTIAMDNDGDFVITWESSLQDGSGFGIYAQRYKSDGNPVGNEIPVNTYTTNDQRNPSIAMDDEGSFIITWNSYGQDNSGHGIYAQRYDNEGNIMGDEFQVNTYTNHDQSNPNIGVDSDGDFIIAWSSKGQDGSDRGIYAQRYHNNGDKLGSEFQVNTYTNSFQSSPSVAMSKEGNFIIVWESFGQDESFSGIYAQRYSDDGNVLGSEFKVNTSTTNSQSNPCIGVDDDGDFIITWYSSQQGSFTYEIYAQRYVRDGSKSGSEFQVNTHTTDYQRLSSVGVDSDGDFIITWQSYGQDFYGYGVYAQRYINNLKENCSTPDINSLVAQTCEKPFSASFDAVEDAVFYIGKVTLPNGDMVSRRLPSNIVSGSFNIPRRFQNKTVQAQLASVCIDADTDEEMVSEFSEARSFFVGCPDNSNLNQVEGRSGLIGDMNAIQLLPNPVEQQLTIWLESQQQEEAVWRIYDTRGRLIQAQPTSVVEGRNEINMDVSALSAGTYFLQIQLENGVEMLKFVKL